VTAFQWRVDEFGSYANVSAGNFTTSVDNGLNFVIFRNINSGQFRATLSTGWSDANLPNTVIQGIVEMSSWIYKQSASGGNWFGLGSVSTGGAGQNVNASILQDLKWQRFFDKYRIAVV